MRRFESCRGRPRPGQRVARTSRGPADRSGPRPTREQQRVKGTRRRLNNQLLELCRMEGRDIVLHTASQGAIGLFGGKQLAERVADRADERCAVDVGPQVAHEVEIAANSQIGVPGRPPFVPSHRLGASADSRRLELDEAPNVIRDAPIESKDVEPGGLRWMPRRSRTASACLKGPDSSAAWAIAAAVETSNSASVDCGSSAPSIVFQRFKDGPDGSRLRGIGHGSRTSRRERSGVEGRRPSDADLTSRRTFGDARYRAACLSRAADSPGNDRTTLQVTPPSRGFVCVGWW